MPPPWTRRNTGLQARFDARIIRNIAIYTLQCSRLYFFATAFSLQHDGLPPPPRADACPSLIICDILSNLIVS
jgi:hypothetical protein